MKPIKARGVIFDLDGTLVDSLPGIAEAANRVLRDAGFSGYPVTRYRQFVGRGLSALITRIFPHLRGDTDRIRKYASDYRQWYRETWEAGTTLYPGILDLLGVLEKKQLPMAILSNKTHLFVEMIVEKMLGHFTFDGVTGSGDLTPKKPDPGGALQIAGAMKLKPEQVMLVGDTEIDMETAARAGMIPVGIQWGFHSARVLRRAGAVKVLRKPLEIMDFL